MGPNTAIHLADHPIITAPRYNHSMDRRLRELERRAAYDPIAAEQLEHTRFRYLPIADDHLELLAHLNFEPAQGRLNWEAQPEKGPDAFRTPNGLTKRVVRTLHELRDMLDRWPKTTNVRIAYYACRAAIEKFEREQGSDYLRRVCDAVAEWLENPDDPDDFERVRACRKIADEGAAVQSSLYAPPRMRAQYGASLLALAVYDDLTGGIHDMPAHVEAAVAAGNAMEFAGEVIGNDVALRAMRDGMRSWVLEQATQSS